MAQPERHRGTPTSTDSLNGTDDKFLGFTSGYPLLAHLLQTLGLPRSTQSGMFTSDSWLYGVMTSTDVPQIPIPSKASVKTMFDIVLKVVSPLYPLYSKNQLDQLIDETYLNGQIARTEINQRTLSAFSLAYSMALNIMSRKDQNLSSLLLPSINFARAGFKELIAHPSLESLTALMALVILNHGCDLTTPVWLATGSCMSMVVELEIYKLGSEEISELENLRRRLFWTTYSVERGLCMILGRPVDRLDQLVSCPYPTDVSRQAIDRFKVRRIQSDIISMMCRQVVPQPLTQEQFALYDGQLQAWFQASEQTSEERLQYANSRLLILRPGVHEKQSQSMLHSVDIIFQNFIIYSTEALEIAMTEGLLVVHDLYVNIHTLLYCYLFCGELRVQISFTQVMERIEALRPLLLDLGRRWRAARENLDLLNAIVNRMSQSLVAVT